MKGRGKQHKAQAKEEPPAAPPIVDPPFQPSSVATNSYDQPVIDFKQYDPSIADAVKNDSLEGLGNFQESPALAAARVVLEVIDNPGFDEMSASSSPAVTDFLQFLRAKVPFKAMITLSETWPCIIPKPHIQMDSFIHLLLRMANESEQPSKFIRWVCMNFPQHKWVKKSTSTNSELMAMGLAIVDGQGTKPLWVALDADSMIHVYRVNNDECEAIIEAKASRTRAGDDKKVIVDGISGEEICRFTPIDAKLSQPWAVTFDKKRASFPMFMTSYDTVVPPIVYKAYESAFISLDGMMVRGLVGNGVIPDQYKFATSILDLFSHAQCVHQLLSTLVGTYLDKPELTFQDTIPDKSVLVQMYKVFIERFGTSYVTGFLNKLVHYIDGTEELGIEKMENINMKKAEKVFFTSLKFIIDSGSLFSDEIRHFTSYLREYSAIRFNKQYFTYNNIADFIGIRFICGVLENPAKYIPDIKIEHPDNVRGICRLLRIAFKLGTMSGSYQSLSSWNKRLNDHVYPKLVNFILSIGDITNKEMVYPIPDDEHYTESLHFLMKTVAEHHKPFMKELESSKKASVIPGILGFNFATAIANYFVHSYDGAEDGEKKHHHKKQKLSSESDDQPAPAPSAPTPAPPAEKQSSSSSTSDDEAPPPPPPAAPPLPQQVEEEEEAPPPPPPPAPPLPQQGEEGEEAPKDQDAPQKSESSESDSQH